MGTKTISIMDDVYGLLKAQKRDSESFSDEIRRLATEKGSILDFAGAWKDVSEEEAKKMKKNILDRRKERERLDELRQPDEPCF